MSRRPGFSIDPRNATMDDFIGRMSLAAGIILGAWLSAIVSFVYPPVRAAELISIFALLAFFLYVGIVVQFGSGFSAEEADR